MELLSVDTRLVFLSSSVRRSDYEDPAQDSAGSSPESSAVPLHSRISCRFYLYCKIPRISDYLPVTLSADSALGMARRIGKREKENENFSDCYNLSFAAV